MNEGKLATFLSDPTTIRNSSLEMTIKQELGSARLVGLNWINKKSGKSRCQRTWPDSVAMKHIELQLKVKQCETSTKLSCKRDKKTNIIKHQSRVTYWNTYIDLRYLGWLELTIATTVRHFLLQRFFHLACLLEGVTIAEPDWSKNS